MEELGAARCATDAAQRDPTAADEVCQWGPSGRSETGQRAEEDEEGEEGEEDEGRGHAGPLSTLVEAFASCVEG